MFPVTTRYGFTYERDALTDAPARNGGLDPHAHKPLTHVDSTFNAALHREAERVRGELAAATEAALAAEVADL